MSRGGIGKSKKKPPPPPPSKRRARQPRARARVEQKPRPGLAVGVGALMLGLSTVVIFVGLVLLSDDLEGGQSALSLGLATLPLGHATVAALSMRQPVIKTTLLAFLVNVGVSTALLLGLAVVGFAAFFSAMTLGIGLGGLYSLRQPEESSVRARLGGIAVVTLVVLLAEAIGFLPVAVVGPFVVLAGINFVDNRSIMQAGSGEG